MGFVNSGVVFCHPNSLLVAPGFATRLINKQKMREHHQTCISRQKTMYFGLFLFSHDILSKKALPEKRPGPRIYEILPSSERIPMFID